MRVIGYSMGGAIALHVAATLPHMVSSLVLIAPAGLIRPQNFGPSRYIFRSGLVPERILSALMRRRLQQPLSSHVRKPTRPLDREHSDQNSLRDVPGPERYAEVAAAETADPTPAANAAQAVGDNQLLACVRWMLTNHAGFLPAFMSCIRYAPLSDEHQVWKAVAHRDRGSTLIILGRNDEVVNPDQFAEDAVPLIGGKSHVRWKYVQAGHDLVVTQSKEILAELDAYWGRP